MENCWQYTAQGYQYGQWEDVHKEAGEELRIGHTKEVAEDRTAQALKYPLTEQVQEIPI